MHFKKRVPLWMVAGVVALTSGCKRSNSDDHVQAKPQGRIIASAPVVLESDIVARVHWLGKLGIAADTNSAGLMRIWNTPESARLEAFALDRFALAPWRLLPGNTNSSVTNPLSILVRPMLDDLVRNESWLEVYCPSNQYGQVAMAIRLNPDRASIWETNLAALSGHGLGSRVLGPGGETGSKLDIWNSKFDLTRSGEWTLLGWSSGTNLIISHLAAQLPAWESAFTKSPHNPWLGVRLDLGRLRALSSSQTPTVFSRTASFLFAQTGWPKLDLSVSGDGQNVLTLGQIDFPSPLNCELTPWNIPTNLIQGPLHSFAAVRGIRPWLASLGLWNDLGLGNPPNQAFFWGQAAHDLFTYCAAPVPDATNFMAKLTGFLLGEGNRWISTNGMGRFERSSVSNSVEWTVGSTLVTGFAQASLDYGSFIFAGFARSDLDTTPMSRTMVEELESNPNLLAYEREVTGARVATWIYLGQAVRAVCYRAQLPFDDDVMKWMQAAEKQLGESRTAVTRTGPAQLKVVRVSTIGLTSEEIQILSDWLESPTFPRGLNTFDGPSVPHSRTHHFIHTNSTPAANDH